MDLALNNLQRLICYKTQPTNQPSDLAQAKKEKKRKKETEENRFLLRLYFRGIVLQEK